jgi:hypothetical protein
MNEVKAYYVKFNSDEHGKNKSGQLLIGSQTCYDKPSVLITYEDKDFVLEIQIPPEICESIGERIIKYGKSLPKEGNPWPFTKGVMHE